MKRLVALLGTLLLLLFSAAAQATTTYTISVVGGAGQTAHATAFFASPLAVKLTDENGQPAVGEVVLFNANAWTPYTGSAFFPGVDASTNSSMTVTTGPDGVAAANIVAFAPGPVSVDVSNNHAPNAVTIPLTVVTGGTITMVEISGSKQSAPVGTYYPNPWVAQALDANNVPVPNAAVFFLALPEPYASVTFDGYHKVWVRADANGFAISPYFKANDIAGNEEGAATALAEPNTHVNAAFFAYHNTATGGGGTGGGGKTVGVCDKPQDNNKDGLKPRIPDNNCGKR